MSAENSLIRFLLGFMFGFVSFFLALTHLELAKRMHMISNWSTAEL